LIWARSSVWFFCHLGFYVGVNVSEPTTIGAAIVGHAELHPNAPAVGATGFEPLSYGELRDYLARITQCLRDAGFDREARIAVALPNGPQAALAILAVACTAVAVPIDMQLAAPEVETRMELLRPRAVIVLRQSPSVARDVALRLGLTVIEAAAENSSRLGLCFDVPQTGAAASLEDPDPAAPAFILQTSGTTAAPKLIPYSHRNMLAAAIRTRSWFGLEPTDRCLSVSPIQYCQGLTLTFLTPLITGGSAAFPASASMLDVNEWLNLLRPTWYAAGPTLQRYMLDKAKHIPQADSNHSLRFIVSGGAPLTQDVHDGLVKVLGVPVLEHYGASEAAQICSNLPPPGLSKVGTCGIPPEGALMIVGEDGRQLAVDEQGEILVRGPNVISGYLDAAELNRNAFIDGWFRTGDIGSLDGDGFLTVHGRKTEIINRGGEKIAPLEIDQALLRHPEVAEAAAFAIPHPRLGEDIAAAVVLREGARVTPMDLREFLASQVALFKVPRRIVLIDHLPKGATGKIQRQRLVERFG
jgi:acyl-CoA synthetase (AMP-forming)/AMP-acid ligase II